MIKVEVDVNVKGLDFLKALFSSKLSESGCGCKGKSDEEPKNWTTNEVSKDEIIQPIPTTPAQAQPIPTPTPIAPTATVAYTFDQIQNCAAALARSGKRDELLGVINSFGVSALTDIKEDMFNDLAAKLRGIGGTL